MRCPECNHDALEPEYFMPSGLMLDGKLPAAHQPTRRRLLRLRCPSCGNYILAQDGETPEAAYQRAIKADPRNEKGDCL